MSAGETNRTSQTASLFLSFFVGVSQINQYLVQISWSSSKFQYIFYNDHLHCPTGIKTNIHVSRSIWRNLYWRELSQLSHIYLTENPWNNGFLNALVINLVS